MDKEQIKKALDAFEDEKYSDAKDILKKEIENSKNEFIKDKLDIDLAPEADPEGDADPEADKDE
jgi:hypothetical protein